MRNKFSKTVVSLLIAGQLAFSFSFLLAPKRAEAVLGIGDFTFNTEIGNFYDILKDIGLGVAQRFAINYANKYIKKYVDKLLDKYRIKDYLAYEKVLSGYYLNEYIKKNVDDPDLRAIYGLLARDVASRAQVTDSSGRTRPVLVALREKLDEYYYDRGGINADYIYNPNNFANDREYFEAARAYFAYPPNFAYEDVYSRFAQLQSRATSAAQQEIGLSEGLKNDRTKPQGVVAKHCTNVPPTFLEVEENVVLPTPAANTIKTETDCRYYGGQWTVNANAIAQAVIQNPSSFIHDFATSSIKQIFESNFGIRDNIYTTIGGLLGNFLFNRLNLNTNSRGVLNEAGDDYQPSAGNIPPPANVDLDGDTIPDGQDSDEDELLETVTDSCYHGGTAPNCKKSSEVVSSPYFTPVCQSIDRAVRTLTTFADFIDTHADQLEGGASLKGQIIGAILQGGVGFIFGGFFGSGTVDNFRNKADADLWSKRAQEASSAIEDLLGSIQSYRSPYFDNMEITISRYSNYIDRVAQSLVKDNDLDLARVGSGGGGLVNLMKNTGYILTYMKKVKLDIGKCENPNLQAISEIPTPSFEPPVTDPTPQDLILDELGNIREEVEEIDINVNINPSS